jgi:LCP family protein required for cell wall assembly
MLSIPRDLYVPLPNSSAMNRINTAIAYGGPAYAMRTVEYNFGIAIQHYVRVNFTAVTTVVDLVGGIDVNVDQDIDDPTYPDMNYGYDPFVISKGLHHMDGATALKYARTRHQTSDFTRMRRQQQIIMALRDRVLSTDAIGRLLPNAPQILSTLSSSIVTDLGPSDIVQLVMLAKDLPPDNITRVTVDETAAQPWTTPGGAQILLPNRNRISQLTAQLYREPVPTLAVAEGVSATERIAIQNASPDRAVAINAQTYLSRLGYRVVDVRNTAQDYTTSVIYDYHGAGAFTQHLATALGLPASVITMTLPAAPLNQVDVLVILGGDYRQGH